MSISTWKISTATVHPSELELSWETDQDGTYYTWTQAKPGWQASAIETTGEIEGYIPALVRTFNELKGIEQANSRGVIVVQVNVTEEGGLSFLATGATPVIDAIHTVEATLRHAVQVEEERTALRSATSS